MEGGRSKMTIGPTKTLRVKPLSRTANRKRIRESIETPDLSLDLSDAQVVIDWSDTYGITPSAIDETLLALIQDRNAHELIFWVTNEDCGKSVMRITGYRDYLDRIKVYNLSNIEVE